MRSRLRAAVQSVGAGEEIEVLGDRELAVERKFLRHVADVLARRGARPAQVEAGDAQRSGSGGQKPAQHAERRRLARAVRTEQAEDLAATNFEADVIDRREGAELAHQVVHLDHALGGVDADRMIERRHGGRSAVLRRTAAATAP